ncbi:MAG TPA: nucleoside hydrolase [Roseiflexaceae bacterium]|nr:nucleoside hydrolase [Roseiflexaceae bacterium]
MLTNNHTNGRDAQGRSIHRLPALFLTVVVLLIAALGPQPSTMAAAAPHLSARTPAPGYTAPVRQISGYTPTPTPQPAYTPTPIWIDSDTGVDDAVALAVLLRSPAVQIRGISSVAGNTTAENATRNILTLLEVAGRTTVPVVYGADAPLVFPLSRVGNLLHGPDGLWMAQRPRDLSGLPRDAAGAICAEARRTPHLTLLTLGPLTNLALATRSCPADLAQITVVALGGAKLGGNRTPVAETNIFIDPQAASEVLHARLRLTLITLDAFNQLKFDSRLVVPAFQQSRDPLFRFLAAPVGTYANVQGQGQTIFTIPDLVAALYVINPSLATPKQSLVVVNTDDSLWRGSTIVAIEGEMVSVIASDVELSQLAVRAFSEPNFDLAVELARIMARTSANAKVVLTLGSQESMQLFDSMVQ